MRVATAGVPKLFSLESYFQNDQLNKIYPPKKGFMPLLKCTRGGLGNKEIEGDKWNMLSFWYLIGNATKVFVHGNIFDLN